MDAEKLKEMAAKSAASLVEDDMIIGLGTGSTVFYAIKELGRRVAEEGLAIKGIPTSLDTRMLAIENNIPITSFEVAQELDIAIDGADEVDKDLNLIKGGGAAHVREKIVASAAERFVVIVDEAKVVQTLSWPVPTEVLPFSWKLTAQRLHEIGGIGTLRSLKGKSGPIISDNGNFVMDVDFGKITDPVDLEGKINAIPGVVECGIFCGMTDEVHVAASDGVKILRA